MKLRMVQIAAQIVKYFMGTASLCRMRRPKDFTGLVVFYNKIVIVN